MDITNPIFHDNDAAREHLETILWPDGPYCPHCGEAEKVTKLQGKSHRPGLYVCNSCRGHFTVTVGTVLERSKIPLCKWVMGFHLMASSKKGVSAHQLHRMLGITYKSAWFMAHRIREAIREFNPSPVGGLTQGKNAVQRLTLKEVGPSDSATNDRIMGRLAATSPPSHSTLKHGERYDQ